VLERKEVVAGIKIDDVVVAGFDDGPPAVEVG
jgi:hypothetical protein